MVDANQAPSPFLGVVECALRQHGVVSRAQALDLGLSPQAIARCLRSGKLEALLPAVYGLRGSEGTWEQRLMAAHLWLGRSSLVSHSAAAALWELPGFPRGPVELSVETPKATRTGIRVHAVSDPLTAVATTVADIPVTNAGRTLLDVCSIVDPDVVEEALEDAIRRKLTTLSHIRWLARSRRGKGAKGIASLRRVIDDIGNQKAVSESRFETQLFRHLRRARLPLPIKQYEIFDGRRFIARPDFAYPHIRLAIEAHSYQFHSGRQKWESDIDRRDRIEEAGWRVLYVTWRQLHTDPGRVIARIRAALGPSLF